MYLRDGAERHWHQHERHCIHPVGLWRVRELQQQRRSPDEWQPVTATGGSAIDIVGNVLKSGSPTISPAPTIGAPVTPDPLASMNPPSGWSSYPNCTVTGPLTGSGTGASATVTTIAPPTAGGNCIVPSGITMSGSASVNFASGFYVLKGGITTSGTSSVSGSGVTFYTPTAGIAMSGTGGINITAPTSGPWEGIAMFQDRSNSSSDTLSGGTTQQINGVVYMPKGSLTFSGGSGVSGTTTTLVVNTVTFSGATYIKIDAPSFGSANFVWLLHEAVVRAVLHQRLQPSTGTGRNP
jgi:hypothetical protein